MCEPCTAIRPVDDPPISRLAGERASIQYLQKPRLDVVAHRFGSAESSWTSSPDASPRAFFEVKARRGRIREPVRRPERAKRREIVKRRAFDGPICAGKTLPVRLYRVG